MGRRYKDINPTGQVLIYLHASTSINIEFFRIDGRPEFGMELASITLFFGIPSSRLTSAGCPVTLLVYLLRVVDVLDRKIDTKSISCDLVFLGGEPKGLYISGPSASLYALNMKAITHKETKDANNEDNGVTRKLG